MDILYGDLGVSKLQFLIKERSKKFQLYFFFGFLSSRSTALLYSLLADNKNLGVKVLLVPEAAEDLALARCAPVGDGGEGGEEPGHLLLPVVEGGGGRHH